MWKACCVLRSSRTSLSLTFTKSFYLHVYAFLFIRTYVLTLERSDKNIISLVWSEPSTLTNICTCEAVQLAQQSSCWSEPVLWRTSVPVKRFGLDNGHRRYAECLLLAGCNANWMSVINVWDPFYRWCAHFPFDLYTW
jgi:hypothetical protein